MSPLVSIIVPCYNQEEFIIDCLVSCVNQTYENIEVIIVDDASTDNSHKLITDFCWFGLWHITGIKHKTNKGVSHARNIGIRVSKGEFIVCLDADDMLTPKSVEYRICEFRRNPKLDVVYGHARKCRDNTTYEWCLKHRKELPRYHRPIYKSGGMNSQTIMVRRRVFEKWGLYYEPLRSAEDREWKMRIGLHPKSPFKTGIKSKKLDKDIAFFRRHPQAKHKLRLADSKWKEETEKIYKKRMKELKREGITPKNTELL